MLTRRETAINDTIPPSQAHTSVTPSASISYFTSKEERQGSIRGAIEAPYRWADWHTAPALGIIRTPLDLSLTFCGHLWYFGLSVFLFWLLGSSPLWVVELTPLLIQRHSLAPLPPNEPSSQFDTNFPSIDEQLIQSGAKHASHGKYSWASQMLAQWQDHARPTFLRFSRSIAGGCTLIQNLVYEMRFA